MPHGSNSVDEANPGLSVQALSQRNDSLQPTVVQRIGMHIPSAEQQSLIHVQDNVSQRLAAFKHATHQSAVSIGQPMLQNNPENESEVHA